jgi:PAP2 superfamily
LFREEGSKMARWHFGATKIDRRVASAVARNASPAIERPARLLTWAADEHVLYVIAAGLWLAARAGDERERQQTDHLALSVIATAILPHLLKRLVDQERPDRSMVHGRRHGIPRSGNAYDAFPSGHAMHVGAVASAVSWSISEVGADRLGPRRLDCGNTNHIAGALDDRRARRPGDGGGHRTLSSACMRRCGCMRDEPQIRSCPPAR